MSIPAHYLWFSDKAIAKTYAKTVKFSKIKNV
jgi:hypothetical protein